MGRGRVALHLFLSGATVLGRVHGHAVHSVISLMCASGVELAGQRFTLAAEAGDRLSHRHLGMQRCPEVLNQLVL